MSKSITPSDLACIQVVVGGDHGDTAFQTGASVSVHMIGNRIINFEVSVCVVGCLYSIQYKSVFGAPDKVICDTCEEARPLSQA
jgi:hypothetical protein